MNSLEQLTKLFTDFPGIGPRQAKRFAYFMLSRNAAYVDTFISLLKDVRKDIFICSDCFRFFVKKDASSAVCDICRSKSRDRHILTIVARDVDLENIEKSSAFNGLYFVLGGIVPILDEAPEKRIRLRELALRIKRADTPITEIVLALNANPDSDHTALIVEKMLKAEFSIPITHLGRGLSTGSELEYSDKETIAQALRNRK